MPRRPPPLALAFHGVAVLPYRQDPHRLFVSPASIDRHVRWLRTRGYRLVTFGALAARARDGRAEGHAALTFDDGLADNLHDLAPVLASLDAPATVFVVSDWIGGHHPDAPDAPMLTTRDIQQLHAGGIEIGTHSRTHRRLPDLDDGEVVAEWQTSRRLLEDALDAEVTVGAYPYGAADDRIRRLTGEAGLVACCRTAGEGDWTEPLELPRQAVSHGSTTRSLRLKQLGWYEPVNRLPGVPRLRRLSRLDRSRRDARAAERDPRPSGRR